MQWVLSKQHRVLPGVPEKPPQESGRWVMGVGSPEIDVHCYTSPRAVTGSPPWRPLQHLDEPNHRTGQHSCVKHSPGERNQMTVWSFTSQYLKVRRVRLLTLWEKKSFLSTLPRAEMYLSFHFPEGVSQTTCFTVSGRMPQSWNSAVKMPTRNLFFC